MDQKSNIYKDTFNDMLKSNNFIRDNKTEDIIDKQKDYFKFESENDEKYNFTNWKNYFYSKNLTKSICWSLGIGCVFYFNKLLRSRSFLLSFKYGCITSSFTFFFVYTSYEIRSILTNYHFTKNLEKKRSNKINLKYESKYYEKTLNKANINKNKGNNIKILNNNLSKDTTQINSDYIARNFLTSEISLLNNYCEILIKHNILNVDNTNKNKNEFSLSKLNKTLESYSIFDIQDIIKVNFSISPIELNDKFNDINKVELAEDFDAEEEDYYLSELDSNIDFRKIKIKSIYIDYLKLVEYNYFNSINNSKYNIVENLFNLNSQYTSFLNNNKNFKAFLDKTEEELSVKEYSIVKNLKYINKKDDLYINNITNTKNIFIKNIPNFDDEFYEKTLKKAKSLLL